MKIGLSSASFYPYVNTEDSIELMKKLNFDYGELFLNSESEYENDFVERLIERKEKCKFTVNSVHSFSASFEPYLFDEYKRRRDDMFKCFKKVCKAASKLGANFYTFHGMRLGRLKDLDMDRIVDTYNEMLYIALENNIKIAQENVSWCMSSNLEFLEEIRNRCKYPVHFTLDIKQAYKSFIEPDEYINVMGENLVNFHINDRDEKNLCLLPGMGNVNYDRIWLKLKQVNYKGMGIIEIYNNNYKSYDEIYKSAEFLKKIFK